MTDLDTCLCTFLDRGTKFWTNLDSLTISFAEIQSGKKLKALRSDNGREYLMGAFEQLLLNSGIKGQQIVPHIAQQNGVAERAKKALYLAPHNIWC